MQELWVGVDGCRRGWVVAAIDESCSIVWLDVQRTFAEVVLKSAQAQLCLVDIPIGLPSDENARPRTCDEVARKMLGPRQFSVFPVPTRKAVWASSYEEASRINKEVLGKRMSRQSWAICSKIREVDAVFRLIPGLQRRIRETHPELCFCLLNEGSPLGTSKRKPTGYRTRFELLRQHVGNIDVWLARACYPRHWVQRDDFLDAIAAAVIARVAQKRKVRSIPKGVERDAYDLRMEMVGVRS